MAEQSNQRMTLEILSAKQLRSKVMLADSTASLPAFGVVVFYVWALLAPSADEWKSFFLSAAIFAVAVLTVGSACGRSVDTKPVSAAALETLRQQLLMAEAIEIVRASDDRSSSRAPQKTTAIKKASFKRAATEKPVFPIVKRVWVIQS